MSEEKLDLIGKTVLMFVERANPSEYSDSELWLKLQELRQHFGQEAPLPQARTYRHPCANNRMLYGKCEVCGTESNRKAEFKPCGPPCYNKVKCEHGVEWVCGSCEVHSDCCGQRCPKHERKR